MTDHSRPSLMGDGPRLALALLPLLALAILATLLWPWAFGFLGPATGIGFVLGAVLGVLGLAFQASSAFTLIRAYRAGRLATRGSYGLCRHPIFAWWIFSVLPALALMLDSWLFILVALAFRLFSGRLAAAEEAELSTRFGAAYEAYKARVRAFLPLPRLRPLGPARAVRLLAGLALVGLLGLAALVLVALPLEARRGATAAEVAMALPGDEALPPASPSYTMAIDIHASPEAVWAWLVQVGYRRAGWYNFDGINRLAAADYFSEGDASARRIIPELQTLAPGDKIYLAPPLGLTVVVSEPSRLLVLVGDPSRVTVDNVAWTFSLRASPAGGTRLVTRFRWGRSATPFSALMGGFFNLVGGATVQQPAMLRGLKLRAEGRISPLK